MLYYISGKITDTSREKELANMEVFYLVERELIAKGFDVFNPARLEVEGKPWEWYLARDTKWIYDHRPAMYMLPGWKESRGARLEYEIAKMLHLCIVEPM